MNNKMLFIEDEVNGLSTEQIRDILTKSLHGRKLRKVLLIPPDYTRLNSGGGLITAMYFELLRSADIEADILPALGTHAPMTRAQQTAFFGSAIEQSRYLVHDWRNGVVKIGEVPAMFVDEVSEGLVRDAIDVEVSRHLLDPSYDLILSIGQVVPHEVAGMANYTKNIVVGCGGSSFINKSHMLGAFYGIERIIGKDNTPVRRVFDYAQQHFISKLCVEYVLTVTVTKQEKTQILGLYYSKGREGFNRAVRLSGKHNIERTGKPIETCVVNLDEMEYHSAWLGNKAIYRLSPAMADGGNLIILAPGVCRFGEDEENDRLIRKYGYAGREKIIKLCEREDDLKNNLSAAAHLIHGSSDNRFTVTYAARLLTKEEVEGAGFSYMPYREAMNMYNPAQLKEGHNILHSGREVFYCSNPALGLWMI